MGNEASTSSQGRGERLKEFSVVYTGAALNLMASEYIECAKDISRVLRDCYNAKEFVMIPGSGTMGMEAVARQFASAKGTKALILRNGMFGFRWTQIFDAMGVEPKPQVMLGRAEKSNDVQSKWTPAPLDQVLAKIEQDKPAVVFASHVETSTGIMLPDDYIKQLGEACRKIDSLFVLDCIASGAMWVNMQEFSIDVLISAPQKAWSGPACVGFVLLQERGVKMMEATTSTSFALDLKKWSEIQRKYEQGGFAYHTTMPTDALLQVRDKLFETRDMGYNVTRERQLELGQKIRMALEERGFSSVAAPGFDAPGVVVVHTPIKDMVLRFKANGVQIAGGMPFKLEERSGIETFRVGLFGLEKWRDVDACVQEFKDALNRALHSNDDE